MFRFSQILRYLFAFAFLFSAYTKWIAPGFFEITLLDQGLVSTRPFAGILSRIVMGVELALGFCLLLPFYRKFFLVLSLLLLTGFTLHLFYLWGLGNQENCGCFGELIALSPAQSILKNAVLFIMAIILFKKTHFQKRAHRVFILFPFILLISPWVFLPLPDYNSFSFSPYTHFEKRGPVDLMEGKKLVAVFNVDCSHCQETARTLADWERSKQQKLPLYVLYFKEGSTSVAAFEAQTQSAYPYTFIDAETFFNLIGNSPPRIYYLQNGQVKDFWDEAFIQQLEANGFNRD